MDDDFNSSDTDFGPQEVDKRTYLLGQDSIDAIIENSAANQLSTTLPISSAYRQHSSKSPPSSSYREYKAHKHREATVKEENCKSYKGSPLISIWPNSAYKS
ncbi:hypothetical protein PENFLA_c028G07007 [Penicillium flavigenum]|uniref:Uncharacterized protein n=1 Tax=Penicillium flavigenum TaxID=254877 RepID=A0A1V6SQK3_9EURO|nr:hypothetical protein PENFLA_c028G07007 [Penicillium flavigenum]